MPTYEKELFDLVRNREYLYYKLKIDEKCLFDEFLKEIEKNTQNRKSLNGIIALMDRLSTRYLLPKTKFRQIQIKNIHNVYEFKKDLLRVYVFKDENEITIILGGYKAKQEKDIEKIHRIIKDYLTNK